jgi:hypothetical protein
LFSNFRSCFSEKFTFRVNPEATANQVGIYLSIMLTDQGADTHPSTLPFCCHQWHIVFKCLTLFQKLTLFIIPGPLISGLPSLSNEFRCNSTVMRMSVYSFQNENDGPQQNATSAARCMQGVLLPAAVGAPPRCACKFLVPHFSSFGVSKQIVLVKCFRGCDVSGFDKASNVSFQVVDDAPDTQSPPTPTPAPPTTNRPLPPSDAASGSSSGAASPGVIAGSIVGAIACKPWQPQPCTKSSRI